MSDDIDRETIVEEFRQTVNLTAAELEAWLRTPESREVGWVRDGERESVGHRSGRRIVDILDVRTADLTDDDLRHMRKVVGYVHRHMAQRPAGDVSHTRWRYSLMNWGCDPLKRR